MQIGHVGVDAKPARDKYDLKDEWTVQMESVATNNQLIIWNFAISS